MCHIQIAYMRERRRQKEANREKCILWNTWNNVMAMMESLSHSNPDQYILFVSLSYIPLWLLSDVWHLHSSSTTSYCWKSLLLMDMAVWHLNSFAFHLSCAFHVRERKTQKSIVFCRSDRLLVSPPVTPHGDYDAVAGMIEWPAMNLNSLLMIV